MATLAHCAHLLDFQMLLVFANFEATKGADVNHLKKQLLKGLYMLKETKDFLDSKEASKKEEDYNKIVSMLSAKVAPVLSYFKEENGEYSLLSMSNRMSASELNPEVTESVLESLVELAHFYHLSGRFREALEFTRFVYHIEVDKKSYIVPLELKKKAAWGMLASSIMLGLTSNEENESIKKNFWRFARTAMFDIKESSDIDTTFRMGLLHWALFVAFSGKLLYIINDLVFERNDADSARLFRNLIELHFPYYIRYIIVSAITNNKKYAPRNILIMLGRLNYSDVFTRFALKLWTEYDFTGVAAMIPEVEEVVAADFFLAPAKKHIVEAMRQVAVVEYIRTHKCVPIAKIAECTALSRTNAETWVARLLSKEHINAKIDPTRNEIIVSTLSKNIYEEVAQILEGDQRHVFTHARK